MHVEFAAGSRQDICTEGSLAIYMNYTCYVKFLDTMLCKPRQKNMNSRILQQNLCVVLTSSSMIALARLNSIIHGAIFMPFSFLAGKTYQFKYHNWSEGHMARVLDNLYKKAKKIQTDP